MSKNIFKIMGVLIVVALFVSMTVGGVSAVPNTLYTGTVDITDGMLALTYDVPNWQSTDPIGDFYPAASALGALREASLEDSAFTYTASYNSNTGAFTISTINGVTASANQKWYPFIGTVAAGTTATQVTDGQQITYFLASSSYSPTAYATISARAVQKVTLAVTIAEPAYNIADETVTVSAGATALDVLNEAVAEGIIDSFHYEMVEDYYTPGQYYAWLTDINGVETYDWDTTGYGYALLKDGVATDSLDQTFFTSSATYEIFMGASEYGGNYAGDTAGGYYLDGITERLSLNVVVA